MACVGVSICPGSGGMALHIIDVHSRHSIDATLKQLWGHAHGKVSQQGDISSRHLNSLSLSLSLSPSVARALCRFSVYVIPQGIWVRQP